MSVWGTRRLGSNDVGSVSGPELHRRPLDPLPPAVERRPLAPRRRLAPEAVLMIWIVAILGTPWTDRQLAEYRVDVTGRSSDWVEATVSFLGNLILQASLWPQWLPDFQRRGAYQTWLAFGPRTVVFLALLTILLNRLARYRLGRQDQQDRLVQALTMFGTVLACAVIAGLVTAPLGDQYYGYYRRGPSAQLLTFQFSGSVVFGVVWGTVLALFSIRRPADPDRHRRPMDLGGA